MKNLFKTIKNSKMNIKTFMITESKLRKDMLFLYSQAIILKIVKIKMFNKMRM
jgi:diacylglycerol kinase